MLNVTINDKFGTRVGQTGSMTMTVQLANRSSMNSEQAQQRSATRIWQPVIEQAGGPPGGCIWSAHPLRTRDRWHAARLADFDIDDTALAGYEMRLPEPRNTATDGGCRAVCRPQSNSSRARAADVIAEVLALGLAG